MIEKMAATDQATKGRIVKAVWIPLFEEFGNDYTIIAPDIRGLDLRQHPVWVKRGDNWQLIQNHVSNISLDAVALRALSTGLAVCAAQQA